MLIFNLPEGVSFAFANKRILTKSNRSIAKTTSVNISVVIIVFNFID
jgi:hypothetical protein